MRIWDVFPAVAEAVRKSHEEIGLFGHHDWFHAFRVGEIARKVALAEWGDERISHIAGAAGLAHNADHLLYHKSANRDDENMHVIVDAIPQDTTQDMVSAWIRFGNFCQTEFDEIINAVLNHGAKNLPEDSRVIIALKDADRIANLEADVIIRAAQQDPNIPAVDYKYFLDNPEATFRNPRSVIKNLGNCLEWADPATPFYVRTRLAREMAEERAARLRLFLDWVKFDLRDSGLYPSPFLKN